MTIKGGLSRCARVNFKFGDNHKVSGQLQEVREQDLNTSERENPSQVPYNLPEAQDIHDTYNSRES